MRTRPAGESCEDENGDECDAAIGNVDEPAGVLDDGTGVAGLCPGRVMTKVLVGWGWKGLHKPARLYLRFQMWRKEKIFRHESLWELIIKVHIAQKRTLGQIEFPKEGKNKSEN